RAPRASRGPAEPQPVSSATSASGVSAPITSGTPIRSVAPQPVATTPRVGVGAPEQSGTGLLGLAGGGTGGSSSTTTTTPRCPGGPRTATPASAGRVGAASCGSRPSVVVR